MLFFGCSHLNPSDLQQAKEEVLTHRAKPQERYEFLISQPAWIEVLKTQCSEEYTAAESQRSKEIEEAYASQEDSFFSWLFPKKDSEALVMQAQKTFNKEILRLTKKVL